MRCEETLMQRSIHMLISHIHHHARSRVECDSPTSRIEHSRLPSRGLRVVVVGKVTSRRDPHRQVGIVKAHNIRLRQDLLIAPRCGASVSRIV